MAKQTAAQKAKAKAAATKAATKAATTQKAPATAPTTTGAPVTQVPATTGATTQPETLTQTAPGTEVVISVTPSLIDQAVAFSMGDLDDEAQAQAAFGLWDLMGCEALPPKLAVAIFDCAHHQGPKVCERLLGKVDITRHDGEYDIIANDQSDLDHILRDFLAWRLRRYAFTAAAATKMLEWSQHILALQALDIIEPEETAQA